MPGCITDVEGIVAGHTQDLEAVTGCTALIFDGGARGGIHYGGHASGTRACDLFREDHLNDELHGLLLSGGSNYGLDAAGGLMAYLRDRGVGFSIGNAIVPLVPQAIIFDLTIGSNDVYPCAEMAYEAASNAATTPIEQGSIGAGTGATVGKIFGMSRAMMGGLGCAAVQSPFGPIGALAVVNAFGDIVDPESRRIICGPINEAGNGVLSTAEAMENANRATADDNSLNSNTTLAVVATEADLSKSALNKLAQLADRAITQTHSPAHSQFDGDVVFAISTRRREFKGEIDKLAEQAAEALTEAILQAVKNARTLAGVISLSDLHQD